MEQQKLPIEIYTEANPNPNSLKFVLSGRVLMPEGSVDFPTAESAHNCALAVDLFKFDFVRRVFITANFITVTKTSEGELEWFEVIPMIKSLIKGYIEENKPLFKETIKIENIGGNPDEPEVITKIKVMLDEYIRPAVEQDGGAITFKSFDEGKVTVELQGSCSGCPSSTLTLKAGIENLLKRMVPEVTEVVAENA